MHYFTLELINIVLGYVQCASLKFNMSDSLKTKLINLMLHAWLSSY